MARWYPWRRRATQVREERVATPPPPRPLWPWLLLLLLLVLAGLGASWYFANRGETVPAEKVPDVTGVRQAEAEQRLRQRKFEVEIERVVSRRPAGTVVKQRPSPGTLYGEGGIVVLSVARDPLRTEVPDVSGLDTPVALARLRAAELRPRAQAVQSKEPKGVVLRQLPPAGTEVPKNSPAIIVVSSGPDLATVPQLVGVPVGQATARVSNAGFRSRVVRVPSTEPEGTVVAQNPAGNSRAPADTVVRLNVSAGPGGAGTTTAETTGAELEEALPDTVGQDEATAQATLEGAGFNVRIVDRAAPSSDQDGIVLEQTPAGGASAPSGTTVTLIVGRLS